MVELFSNFTTTLVIVGVLLALGIIFEKQLIALEDKFDELFGGIEHPVRHKIKRFFKKLFSKKMKKR